MMLCECGCGQETNIYRGKQNRFINGHHNRCVKVSNPMMDRINIEGITHDIVRELFDYRDGNLYWKISNNKHIKIGDRAGHVLKTGHRTIGINYKGYRAHRLIFLYHHGYLPEFLDHIDGDRLNNSIDNLREATCQENTWNRMKLKSVHGTITSSVYKGVSWHEHHKKWRVSIQINGKRKPLGLFTSETEAARAYDKAANELFGEFANTNIKKKR